MSRVKFEKANKQPQSFYPSYPMNDLGCVFTHYNPKTGRNEPTPNIIVKEENDNAKGSSK